jgi:hypothetical protein
VTRKIDDGALGRPGRCVQAIEPIPQPGIRLWIQVAVAVKGETDRGVPGPHRDLLGGGARGDPQRDRRVAKVVDPHARQPGRFGGWPPDPVAEPNDAQRAALRRGEDMLIQGAVPHKVHLELADHETWQADGAPTRAGLGRTVWVPKTSSTALSCGFASVAEVREDRQS